MQLRPVQPPKSAAVTAPSLARSRVQPSWPRQLGYWIVDYSYMAAAHARGLRPVDLPARGPRGTILLVPGIFEGQSFMVPLARQLAAAGFGIHILPTQYPHAQTAQQRGEMIRHYLQSQNLSGVTIIAHSKGGLDALMYLAGSARDGRVTALVAVATPFNGSSYVTSTRLPYVGQFMPGSPILKAAAAAEHAGVPITSIAPRWDNHVRHPLGSYFAGAANVTVPVYGHHRVLFSRELANTVLSVISRGA